MYDLLIFCGQSNMQGQAETISEQSAVRGAKEYRFLSDSLVPLKNPVGENITYDLKRGCDLTPVDNTAWFKNTALGASAFSNTNMLPSFCRAYVKRTGRKVIAVHAAKGATMVREWQKGTGGYHALSHKVAGAIKLVGKENIDKIFVVWLQGESDAIAATSKEEYKRLLRALKDEIKAQFEINGFGIIRVGDFTMSDRDGVIQRAQEELCREDNDFYMLTDIAKKLCYNKRYMNAQWHGHYNAAGLTLLGKTAGNTLGNLRME